MRSEFIIVFVAISSLIAIDYWEQNKLDEALEKTKKISEIHERVLQIKENIISARQAEKEFLLHRNEEPAKIAIKRIQEAQTILNILPQHHNNNQKNSDNINKIKSGLIRYSDLFAKLFTKEQEIGLVPLSGLKGDLDGKIKWVERSIRRLKGNP